MKRPACFSVADRRVSKLRDGWGQLCRRHVEPAGAKDALRPTVEDETQGALRSRCPAEEAINSNRKTSAQREKDQCQLRRFGPRCLRRTNVKLRSGSIPSWETLRSTRATGITHPGFYGWKPWKSLTTHPLLPRPTPQREGFRHPFRRLPPKCSQKFTTNPAHVRPVYRRHRPKVRTRLAHRRSSCCFSALRVS